MKKPAAKETVVATATAAATVTTTPSKESPAPVIDNLKALEIAFKELSFDYIVSRTLGGKMETAQEQRYSISGGEAYSFSLFKNEHVAVALTRVILNERPEKQAIWTRHHHKEWEAMICVSGAGEIYKCSLVKPVLLVGRCDIRECVPEVCRDAKKIPFTTTKMIEVPPETIHSIVFNSDMVFISITIPASEFFPGGKVWEMKE